MYRKGTQNCVGPWQCLPSFLLVSWTSKLSLSDITSDPRWTAATTPDCPVLFLGTLSDCRLTVSLSMTFQVGLQNLLHQ